MARQFGRFTTSIHDSDEFRALTLAEQGAYFLVSLQGEISAAGVLPLRLRRWSKKAKDLTTDELENAIDALRREGHVECDDDTEEVIVVKFIKWDQGYANPTRRKMIDRAISEIESDALRRIALNELSMCLAKQDDGPCHGTSKAHRIEPDGASSERGFPEGYVTTTVAGNLEPGTGSREPTDAALPPGCPPRPLEHCKRHRPDGTDDACGACGRQNAAVRKWDTDWAPKVDAWRKANAKALRDNCPDCHGSSLLIDEATGKTIGKCDHRRTA